MKLPGLWLVSLVAPLVCSASPPSAATTGPRAVPPALRSVEPLPSSVISRDEAVAVPGSGPAATANHDGSGDPRSPADGAGSSDAAPAPRIYSTGYINWIVDRPHDEGRRLGFVRSGYGVALRNPEKLAATDRCRGGWYAVEPLGFVCKSQQATLDPEHPLVRAVREAVPPQAGAFPLSYAFSLGAPMYNLVPSVDPVLQAAVCAARRLLARRLRRSEERGLPNLAPLDALWLFGFTDPVLPDGWQGVAPAPGEKATVVVLGA